MNKIYVVTEGKLEVELLRRVLAPELIENIHFVTGSGRYSAQTLASSLLADRQKPVALIVDSDTHNLQKIREQNGFLVEFLGQAATNTRFAVILAVPEIEVILVEDKRVMDRLVGRITSENEHREAKLSPKKTLARALEGAPLPLDRLGPEEIRLLREHPLVTELLEFVREPAAV